MAVNKEVYDWIVEAGEAWQEFCQDRHSEEFYIEARAAVDSLAEPVKSMSGNVKTRFEFARELCELLKHNGYSDVVYQEGYKDEDSMIICCGEVLVGPKGGDRSQFAFRVQVDGPWVDDGQPMLGWDDQEGGESDELGRQDRRPEAKRHE